MGDKLIATKLDYGYRATFNRPRWCSACGCQRETVRGRFIEHNTPTGQHCGNSGKSVRQTQEEAAG
jgi:hypothetical protein